LQQAVGSVERAQRETPPIGWLQKMLPGSRQRRLREYLTGYLMIFPASLLIFMFGIFPVGFALFVSLHKWRLRRGDFIGITNYVKAVDSLAYILLFAMGIGAIIGAVLFLRKVVQSAIEKSEKPWLLAIPGFFHAAALIAFVRWSVLQLPEVLDIALKIIGVEKTQELFYGLLGEAFKVEHVLSAFYSFLFLAALAIIVGFVASRIWKHPRNLQYQAQFAIVWLVLILGVFLLWFTYGEAARAYQISLEAGTPIEIWPQVITIGSGVLLIMAAWFVWRSAEGQPTNRGFIFRLLAAITLLIAGWMLIAVLPPVIAAGDEDLWSGLKVTVFYSLQKLTGSEAFRMLFFLPYVTPYVASAVVFRQMFSIRPQAPVNQLLKALGFDTLRWIQEPEGIFTLIAEGLGFALPEWASGPSLALVVIMIYSIWVYVGYNTVIYLAGLGNISTELIEAAEIDGAGRWEVFRHIIFPLLSPTTYFLSLIAIIGTFKAFAHIWVMRHDLALGTVNTFSVSIFLEFFDKVRYGYASALAFVLFAIILSLTFINNKIQGSRVFYG